MTGELGSPSFRRRYLALVSEADVLSNRAIKDHTPPRDFLPLRACVTMFGTCRKDSSVRSHYLNFEMEDKLTMHLAKPLKRKTRRETPMPLTLSELNLLLAPLFHSLMLVSLPFLP